jgi:hypothetical protein
MPNEAWIAKISGILMDALKNIPGNDPVTSPRDEARDGIKEALRELQNGKLEKVIENLARATERLSLYSSLKGGPEISEPVRVKGLGI